MLKTDSDSLGRDELNDDKFLTQPNIINIMMFSGPVSLLESVSDSFVWDKK
jgi:hypothetical protein